MTAQVKNDLRLKVFISHSWVDKQIADQLARDVEQFADVWMDWRNLRPGDSIQESIDHALGEMDLVLVVWTENSPQSDGMEAELRKAAELGIRIAPCLFAYDDQGRPTPFRGLLGEKQYLGVDFHHYGTGLAKVAELILGLQTDRLTAEASMQGQPGTRLLRELQAYLGYLANYRKLREPEDKRSYYVNRIIEEIERYAGGGGDPGLVRALLEAARRSDVDDPEGIGMLVNRLEKLLGVESATARRETVRPPTPPPPPAAAAGSFQWSQPEAPPRDDLDQRVAQVVPAGTANAWVPQVQTYIDSAPRALQAMTAYAWSQQSPAGAQVAGFLRSYLDNAEDLIPDRAGRYGLLDDAWLILNTAFRLIESGILPAAVVPLDWRTIIHADYVVRSIMPQPVLTVLSGMVMQMLQVIAAEVAGYQPWFTPQGNGYAPVMAEPASAGGCWEDQMNEMLLGTGLSV